MDGQDSNRENSLQIIDPCLETQQGTTDQHLFADPRKMARSVSPALGSSLQKQRHFRDKQKRL